MSSHSRKTVHELVLEARGKLRRVTALQALEAVARGAVLVDIRCALQRSRDGEVPGAVRHPRNVLEWRADPSSGHDDPRISADFERRIVVICNEGYQSSLAAATLQDLGFVNATDLVGGFQAWRDAGLPVDSHVP